MARQAKKTSKPKKKKKPSAKPAAEKKKKTVEPAAKEIPAYLKDFEKKEKRPKKRGSLEDFDDEGAVDVDEDADTGESYVPEVGVQNGDDENHS